MGIQARYCNATLEKLLQLQNKSTVVTCSSVKRIPNPLEGAVETGPGSLQHERGRSGLTGGQGKAGGTCSG